MMKRLTLPMDRLDQAVIDDLERRLLQPERLAVLMGNVLDRRSERIERRRSHIAELGKRATEAEARLTRLYAAIEDRAATSGAWSLKDRIA